MAKVQKLEESLCATEKLISSLEKSRDADKVGRGWDYSPLCIPYKYSLHIVVSCSQG